MAAARILENFVQGLPMPEREFVSAAQGQSYGPLFDEKLTVAAWKTKSSWVIISASDRILPPPMEQAEAKKLDAAATTLPTRHPAMLEDPETVAAVIDQAAEQVLSK
jgi:hypothetical protein